MSNPESFIDEVTEEVRRDKLYAALRKYGWIGIVTVVAIVAGAAYVEWQNARQMRAAQATGDAVLAAMESDDRLAALADVEASGNATAVIELIAAAEAEDPARADSLLEAVAQNAAYPVLYRDLATMKRVLVEGSPMSPEDRIAALEPLTVAGGAFRVLAEEQIALAALESGDREAAVTRLQGLMDDAESTDSQRARIDDLLTALGAARG